MHEEVRAVRELRLTLSESKTDKDSKRASRLVFGRSPMDLTKLCEPVPLVFYDDWGSLGLYEEPQAVSRKSMMLLSRDLEKKLKAEDKTVAF